MKNADFNKLAKETIDNFWMLRNLKGAEYAGTQVDDCLANFKRNGLDLGLPSESIWRVYAAKHWDAIGQYIRDIQTNTKRDRLESISGRVDDLIVYLMLFKAMIVERERENAQQSVGDVLNDAVKNVQNDLSKYPLSNLAAG